MKMTYREALREGLTHALEKNPNVFLIGEDVGAYGGTYAVTKDFLQIYGPERIMDAPLSEVGFVGIGIGAALGGMKPIVEIMTVNFSLLALDQLINSAAIFRHMSAGQLSVPLVVRMTTGGGRQLAAQHSNSFEGWLAHIPGLKILVPASVEDARSFLTFALKGNDPVLIFEHALLLNRSEEVSSEPITISPFKALIRKEGPRLSLITYGGMLPRCLDRNNYRSPITLQNG
jgi:pyruvate dehydrogenase E1 component beta subunit